jgi:hypothetical protein
VAISELQLANTFFLGKFMTPSAFVDHRKSPPSLQYLPHSIDGALWYRLTLNDNGTVSAQNLALLLTPVAHVLMIVWPQLNRLNLVRTCPTIDAHRLPHTHSFPDHSGLNETLLAYMKKHKAQNNNALYNDLYKMDIKEAREPLHSLRMTPKVEPLRFNLGAKTLILLGFLL